MPARAKNLVGLEIEPHGVTAAQATVSDGAVAVRRAAFRPLPAGVVRDGEILDPEEVTAALRELWKAEKGLGKRVRVGIANQKIVVRIIELPPLSGKELEAAVRFRAQDEIPMPLDAAVLDWQSLDEVLTNDGPRRRVLLVAARRDMVERVLSVVRAAGLRCDGIDLAAFGLVRALHRPEHDEDGHVLYLSVGGLTNLAVAQGTTCVFTRATGGGIDALAVELAERQGITVTQASELLRRTSVPMPDARPEPDAVPGWGDVPDPAARGAEPAEEAAPVDPPPLRWDVAPVTDAPTVEADAPTVEAVVAPADPEAPTVEADVTTPAEMVDGVAREILAEGVRRIAAEVRTSLDFHNAQGADGQVGRVVLTGPATALPGFAEALGAQLKLPVEAAGVRGVPEHAPHASVAAGLALEEAPA